MPLQLTIQVGSLTRQLPLREILPGLTIALFDILGDWELVEEAGRELARFVPEGTEALAMPDGKAQALLHVMGRETGLPTFVARKSKKPYMGECVSVPVKSITTDSVQTLFLSQEAAEKLAGKAVAIVDDVVSTGASLEAMADLLRLVGAHPNGGMAVFTEGSPRPNIITLGHLPIYTGTGGVIVL